MNAVMTRSLQLALLLVTACASLGGSEAVPASEVVSRADVRFVPLNPARGDASPQAGVLWGDLRKDVPTGAIIEFADGFASPPHIHNVSYRGVVLAGALHNDDPGAASLWMSPGSFWTQPAGESHVTAAKPGSKAVAFLEIGSGPYLVLPPSDAFDSGERPLNLDARNVVWLETTHLAGFVPPFAPDSPGGPKLAFLWGSRREGEPNGSFLKLPSRLRGELRGTAPWLRAVVIQGHVEYRDSATADTVRLAPGSYLGAWWLEALEIGCAPPDECLVYVSTEGRFEFTPR